MSVNLKLLDSFKFTGTMDANFACGVSQDDRIFVISELGLYILSQRPNLNSAFSEYSCHKYFLKPSTFALCEKVDIDINNFVHELPKDVMYESVISINLTYNLNGTSPIPPKIICAQWSEANMVDSMFSMLGTLTNIHCLEIYIKTNSESNVTDYRMVLNLTNEILERRKADFVYSAKMPSTQKMRELRKRVEYIAPLSFEWSHTFKYRGQNCAVIFVGHFHGVISVWRIFSVKSDDSDTQCDFLGRYSSKMGHISAIYWHRTADYDGALCLGDSDGKITVLKIKHLDQNECSIDNEVEFFSKKDTKVDKITVVAFEQYTFLIAVKQCYLLVFGMNSSGNVFDFAVYSVNNFYITGISRFGNIIRVLTLTGCFKELVLTVDSNKIIIAETDIPVKFDFSSFKTHGFVESSNKVLFAFVSSPCQLRNSIKGKRFVNFCLFNDVNLNPLKLLLENKSGSLRTYWDCFEALRIICIKEQRFPWLGLSANLELDNMSLVELKTLRLIAKLSETVFAFIKRVVTYEIKPYIILHYLVDIRLIIQRLTKLFKDREEGRELSLFELRSIDLQVFYLKELIVNGILPKAQTGDSFVKSLSHIIAVANELKYPDTIQCNICGEKLIGSTCLPPHADSRCVFTMMPIFLAPSFKCILCNSLAHSEVGKELNLIICPYCDYPMERISLSENIRKQLHEYETTFEENQGSSKCFHDCVVDSKETLNELLLNIEENELVVINLSDDEDETDENLEEDKIKHLYFKIGEIKFDDHLNLTEDKKG